MLPLPAEQFDPARLRQARVDGRARVYVRQNYYSVPARYVGRRLPVRLSATAVEVPGGPQIVARHERVAGKYAEILVLDHYLGVLRYKPGALPGPPRWPRPGRPTHSPPPTSGTGTPPATSTATRRDPGADRGIAHAPRPARRSPRGPGPRRPRRPLGAGTAGGPRPAPARRAAREYRRGPRLRYQDIRKQSKQVFDKQKKGGRLQKSRPGTGSSNLITAEPPGEAASHRTRCE